MSTPISKIEDPQAAGVANALLQAHLTSLDPVAARMATPSAIGVQGTSQPSRWQQRRDLKRMMYQESTEQKIVIPQRQGTTEKAERFCQKCLERGHATYECKNQAKYIRRPSCTQQMKFPVLRPTIPEVPAAFETKRQLEADKAAAAEKEKAEKAARKAAREKRREKRKKVQKRSRHHSPSSSSDSDSDSGSSSSSSGSSRSGSGISSSESSTSSSSDSGSSSGSESSSSSESDTDRKGKHKVRQSSDSERKYKNKASKE